MFFGEFFLFGDLGVRFAVGVPGVHLSSDVCTSSSVFTCFYHQILLHCLLLLAAYLCLALPHLWLSVGTLVVVHLVCHRWNMHKATFFFKFIIHLCQLGFPRSTHESVWTCISFGRCLFGLDEFPPHCNWCIFFIFSYVLVCLFMRQCMSMHLHQENCDTMRPTNHPKQELYKKGCPFLKALQNDVLNLCPLSNQDAPNAPTWGQGWKTRVVRGTWHIFFEELFWPEIKRITSSMRTGSLLWRDMEGP